MRRGPFGNLGTDGGRRARGGIRSSWSRSARTLASVSMRDTLILLLRVVNTFVSQRLRLEIGGAPLTTARLPPVCRGPLRRTVRTGARSGWSSTAGGRRPAPPRRCAGAGRRSVSSATALAAIPSRSSGSCRNPVTPFSITSGRPPTRDAMTGTSHAIASSAARPKLSVADGSRNTSDADRSERTSSCSPTARTSPATPRSRASSRPCGRSGPSPTSTSVAGTDRRIRANTSTRAGIRFTGRKFDTWITTAWPSGASRCAQAVVGVHAVVDASSRGSSESPGCRVWTGSPL